jgi:hypothetical protein
MKNNLNKIVLMAFAMAITVSACKKDDDDVTKPSDTNDEELITTVKFLVREADSPNTQFVFQYRDVDGLGGNAPSIDTIKLNTDRVYSVEILLLDETKTPFDTVSNEVRKEADEHLFVFEPASSNLNITINDFDDKTPPLPLGLLSTWSAGAAISSSIKISLKHQPGIKNGDPTRGESDVEVVMPFEIK